MLSRRSVPVIACWLRRASLAYVYFFLALSAVVALVPRRNGTLALVRIFAPYLLLPVPASVPLALPRSGRKLWLPLLGCLLAYGLVFGPTMPTFAIAREPSPQHLSAITWNVLFRNERRAIVAPTLRQAQADIVALQEITPEHRDMIERDPVLDTRYPYRLWETRPREAGMALLSKFPILDHGALADPATLWARLDLGSGRRLMVVNAHPILVNIDVRRFDTSHRDAGITRVRQLIAPVLQRGEPLLLLGDFNVTEREPAYRDLRTGLLDAAAQTQLFPANTWKSENYKVLPRGLLRIDYLFTSPQLRPVNASVDCTPRGSDHCILTGAFDLRSLTPGTGP